MAVEFPLSIPDEHRPWRNIYLVNGGSGISAHVGRFYPDASTSMPVPSEMREVHIDVTGGMTMLPAPGITVGGSRVAKAFGVYETICQLGHVEWIDEVMFTRFDTHGLEFRPMEPAVPALPPLAAPEDRIKEELHQRTARENQMVVMMALFSMLGGGDIVLDMADLAVAQELTRTKVLEIHHQRDPFSLRIRMRDMGK